MEVASDYSGLFCPGGPKRRLGVCRSVSETKVGASAMFYVGRIDLLLNGAASSLEAFLVQTAKTYCQKQTVVG